MATQKCVVLVGTTGNGKSTTGNTLAGRNCFATSDGFESQTRLCSVADYEYERQAWRIVDTIGMADTEIASEEVLQRFSAFSDQAPDGVDAFLYVVRHGRFENEHDRALQAFVTNCGDDALKRTILVFTQCPYSAVQMKQRLHEQQNQQLRKWLKSVQTWVGIENYKHPEEGRAALHESIGFVCKKNKGLKYMNEALQAARARRNELKMKMEPLRPELMKQANRVLCDLSDGACDFESATSEIHELVQREENMQKKERELKEAQRQAKEAMRHAVEADRVNKSTGDRRATEKVISKHVENLHEFIHQLCSDGRQAAKEAIQTHSNISDSREVEALQMISNTVQEERGHVRQLFDHLAEEFEAAGAEVEAFKRKVGEVREQNENDIQWIKNQERSANEELDELQIGALGNIMKKRRIDRVV